MSSAVVSTPAALGSSFLFAKGNLTLIPGQPMDVNGKDVNRFKETATGLVA
jgi:hypothetical protein